LAVFVKTPLRLTVVQAHSLSLTHGAERTLPAVHVPVVPAEALLVEVTARVLAADVVPRALDAPLEQAVEGLAGVVVDVATNVLLHLVLDALVTATELAAEFRVELALVRQEPRVLDVGVARDELADLVLAETVQRPRAGVRVSA
jgi:hypothetical protein